MAIPPPQQSTERVTRRSNGERVVRVEAGPYIATVSEIGGALVSLTHHGRPLVYEAEDAVPEPRFRGAVLAPWPNRIADGRYLFDGRAEQLPVNETARGTALHGLALYHSWTLVTAARDAVVFNTTIWPQPGYPFTVTLNVSYELSAETGLRISLVARNTGDDVAPYGASTLAGLTAVCGVVYYITKEGDQHPLVPGHRAFETLGTGSLTTLGTPVWIMLVLFALGWLLLNRTAFGQTAQAVGGNEAAATLMGLAVRRTTVIVYTLSALCAGLAGILTTALAGGGQEARIGDFYELQAIAAVVIGGTLLSGGVGSLIGSLAGVSLLFVIQNLIVQGANLNSYVQQVVSGGFLLVVVILQATLARRSAGSTVT